MLACMDINYEEKKILELKEKIFQAVENAKNAKDIREYYKQLVDKTRKPINSKYLKYFAKKEDINLDKINLSLEFVEDKETRQIFKSAISFWNVPITVGYGRRINFIIWDKGNNKVAGIVGLCDPVISLSIRDNYIGWNKEQKINRLYNVMNAYVLGAVPPYNELLVAKFVALITGSKEIRDYFRKKYANKTTIIRQEKKINELAAINVTTFFGQSPIYHSLKEWHFLGYTQGHTYAHFVDIWEDIVSIGREVLDIQAKPGYGNGPSYRFRVISEMATKLGIKGNELTFIGHKKGYYFRPLVNNWKDFLQMKTDHVGEETCKSFDEYQEFWKKKFFEKGKKRYINIGVKEI